MRAVPRSLLHYVAPRRRFAALLASLALCAGLAAPVTTHAYSAPDAYAEKAYDGGGGGRWFTGSPAEGLGCGTCHLQTSEQPRFPLRVAGLPKGEGYGLLAQHEVVLSWPEFSQRWSELRPNPMLPPVQGAPVPSMGLVAELVAESGTGSGTIEINTAAPMPGELCEQTRANLKPRLAARLYQVRANVPALQVRPDAAGILRCEARLLGQRCLIALSSCGARELRFRWTAPPSSQGPIWFSAGFVASEALSGTFDGDEVDEISVPLVPLGTNGGRYRQELQSGCGLIAVGSASAPRAAWLAALACTCIAWRRRQRSARAAGKP